MAKSKGGKIATCGQKGVDRTKMGGAPKHPPIGNMQKVGKRSNTE